MTIRAARDEDWPAILEVHRHAFGDDDVPRLCEDLRARDLVVHSFVAEVDGAVVGHVMNDLVGIEGSERSFLQLSPLGVLPEHQGRGHGGALVRTALEAARAEGEPLLFVEGDPRYYGRFGFVRADELGLLPPPEALHDWAFQVAILDPAAPVPRGRVVYPPSFAQ